MAGLSKWLEALVGPQLAGAIAGGGADKSPIVPGGALAPPAPVGGSIADPIAAPPPIDLLGTTPQDMPLPGLGGPPLPPDIAPNPPMDAPPITVPGSPLNAALGLEPPDPTRVENTGSLVPQNVDVAVPEIPPIAPPPAIAQQLAAKKAAAGAAPQVQRSLQRPTGNSGTRPLSPVSVQSTGGSGQRGAVMGASRTGPMGTPLYQGQFRSPAPYNPGSPFKYYGPKR